MFDIIDGISKSTPVRENKSAAKSFTIEYTCSLVQFNTPATNKDTIQCVYTSIL